MSIRQIHITIPSEAELPDILSSLTPEENYWMLKIGCDSLREGRRVTSSLTSDELYKKIEQDFKQDIEQLEQTIRTEQQTSLKMQDKMTSMYELQLEQLHRKLETAMSKIMGYEQESSASLETEIQKIKQKYELMYREKETQVARMTDVHEKLLVQLQTTKSTSHKGSEGEKKFEEYAEVFIDFKGYELADKHTQGGEGDFHLHFEEFDILVDAKNYKKKVPNDQREKIKKDLQKNEHLQFGWLVSLNTSIEKYDKSPIMYEWINTRQCLVYINNLCSFEDPKKILRIVWFTCKALHDMTKEVNFDEEEIAKLKDIRYKTMDKVRNLRKNIREINTSMNATRNLVQVMDDELKGMLESETNEMVASHVAIFDEWWDANIEVVSENTVSASTDLWTRFKQENKYVLTEMDITGDKFKQYLKTKVPMSAILLRSKNANAAFDIKGVHLKEVKDSKEEGSKEDAKIEVELNEEVMKKKKVVKKSQI
ncbi:MAG: hypothetical protein ACOVRN_00840 [Flavobacterium sp.]